ncbi:alpha-ketoglutarate-dependent dioxygenase AlkB [Sphingomonas sp. MMS24-J13]|uniref:alpha-ketoglutarate-dependent dioxygenase AlkB n=1 Tax=Sphingomonas sp. MMS24-J13 TaxID=3238686 RepID=UPI00384B9D1C
MPDLFDTPIVPGLAVRADLISAEEEAALIAAIDAQALTPFRFQQWTGKRLTHSFGWAYDFQAGELNRAEPIPAWLYDVQARMAAMAGLDRDDLIQALLIRYDPGAGIGWHRDRPVYDHVLGLSLGAPATMRFRRKEADRWRRASLLLEPRAAYHLSGEVRHDWEHSIAAIDRTRYSITFRSPSAQGRALLRLQP